MQKAGMERGFTLIELIVVLAIVGVSAALVLPRFAESVQNARVKTALRDSSNLMRKARIHSVFKRQECRVVVDREKGTMVLQDAEKTDGEETPVLETIQLPQGLSIDRLETEFWKKKKKASKYGKKKEVIFYPMGNSSGGRLHLKDKKEKEYLIEVNPLNGRVKIIDEVGKKS